MIATHHTTAGSAVVALLNSFSFLQQKLDRPGVTHVFMLRRALEIIRTKKPGVYASVKDYVGPMTHGVLWADTDWKNSNHYYHPKLERGMWLFSSASKECLHYYRLALQLWKDGQKSEAMVYLGAAAHLLQDVCVPFHTIPQLLWGHRSFEEYAEEHAMRFLDRECNGPEGVNDIAQCVKDNALFSSDFLPTLLREGASAYDTVLAAIAPQALQSTIHLVHNFVTDVS